MPLLFCEHFRAGASLIYQREPVPCTRADVEKVLGECIS